MEDGNSNPAEKIALWADQLRDLAATGLRYADNPYDRGRYETIQQMAMDMTALSAGRTLAELEPLRATLFGRMSPVVAGAAAVIDEQGKILLMRRSDNGLWSMPAGQMEVGESPAEAVVRETFEETGVSCEPVALVSVYDSVKLGDQHPQQVYKFTFLCKPLSGDKNAQFDPRETLEIGWFAPDELPQNLYHGHAKRIEDAYQIRAGNLKAKFDW